MTAAISFLLTTQAGQAIVVATVTALVTAGGHWLATLAQRNARTENLALIAEAAAKAVDEAVTVAASAPPNQRLGLAIAAARASLVADYPGIEKALGAELTVLVAGHAALQTVAPGGAVVTLPTSLKGA